MEQINRVNREQVLLEIRQNKVWENLSSAKVFPWSEQLILKYKDNWDWDKLSTNKSITWTVDILEETKERLNWEDLSISIFDLPNNRTERKNQFLFRLINHFESDNDIEPISDSSRVIPFDIILKFANKWCWKDLINCPNIDWTIEKYNQIKPHLNDIDLPTLINSHLLSELVKQDQKILIGKLLAENH